MAPDASGKIAIFAGSGGLPRLLIAAAQKQNRSVVVVAFKDHTDPATVENIPHIWTRMGAAGSILAWLRAQNVKDIIMAGAIRRPNLIELRPDWYAARFFLKLGRRSLGDDGLLKALARTLEEENFRLLGTGDLLENVLSPLGNIGNLSPNDTQQADIHRGIEVVTALGKLDVGQAAIIQDGIVLCVEAAEGTDAMLNRSISVARQGSRPILVKLSKPQQDQRLDLPTIGLQTLEAASKAGLAGIAIEAGKTILLDGAQLAETANRLGLFLIGINID